jgi:ankyrin repeat protein
MDHDPQWRKLIARFQREQLHSAAQSGDLAEVDRLLAAKYPVNKFDSIGKTPLHYAAAGGHFEVVDRLLKAGANVNAHDERQIGDTPLNDIAGECIFEMAKKLIDAGADPTIPGWMQMTAVDRVNRRKDANAKKVQQLLHAAAKQRTTDH